MYEKDQRLRGKRTYWEIRAIKNSQSSGVMWEGPGDKQNREDQQQPHKEGLCVSS